MLAAKTGGSVERATRDNQREVLLGLMKTLMIHVNYMADGDRSILESTGFTVNAEVKNTGKNWALLQCLLSGRVITAVNNC